MLGLLKIAIPLLLPISRALNRVPVVGKLLKRVVPVANYEGMLPLTETQLREWALLDTFDWLAPAFDNPQNAETIQKWFKVAKFTNVEILKSGHLVGRGIKV